MTSSPPSRHNQRTAHAPAHAVLFDNDGVLVNSEPLHRAAWEKVFGPRGILLTEADYAWGIGRRDITFAEAVAARFRLPEAPEVLRDEKRSHFLGMMTTGAQTFEGLPELVRWLSRDHSLGVVSSAMREEVDIVIRRFGLGGLFGAIVTNEDVTRHKPDPEPYLLCARRLEVEPGCCVAFEDSVPGITAAKSAGMRVIAVASTFPESELSAADAVVSDVADVAAVARLVESLQHSAPQTKL